MADPRSPQDERRYSAIILSHPRIGSEGDLVSHLGALADGLTRVDSPDVTMSRFDLLGESLLYPGATDEVARRLRRGKLAGKFVYAHESYAATIQSKSVGPFVVLGAPYKSLIKVVAGQLNKTLDAPLVRFCKLDMSRTFEYLAHRRPGFEVLRIRAQRPDDPNVSTVTLDGEAPLDSNTWFDLQGRKTPYGITVRHVHAGQPVRVHLDRTGNASWYQPNEDAAPSACALLTKLALAGLGDLTDNSPLSAKARKAASVAEEEGDDIASA